MRQLALIDVSSDKVLKCWPLENVRESELAGFAARIRRVNGVDEANSGLAIKIVDPGEGVASTGTAI